MVLRHKMESCVELIENLSVEMGIALLMRDVLDLQKMTLLAKEFHFSEKQNYAPEVIAIS